MRFGQRGTLSRKWARKGSRPPAVKQTQYDYVYVIGDAYPSTGKTAGLLSPYINSGVMNVFLEQMAREIDPDVHVVMLWNQAGFHRSTYLRIPENITIVPLPPYSPEPNPVENLWHYLRSHAWSNRTFEDYRHLCTAACEAWQKYCLDTTLIKSVCNAPYAAEHKT